MLDSLVGWSSLWVATCYIVIGLLVVPNLRFPAWVTALAALFFVGCALTHAHIASEVFAAHTTHPFHAMLMVVLHVVQGIGGTGFIAAIYRKRLIVKMEDEPPEE